MPPRVIAIGDVHGCSRALRCLLDAIRPTEDDLLIPLGDYIDRGPDSRGVVQTWIDLIDRCQVMPLLGNHEQMLLEACGSPEIREIWLQCGGAETLESYGGALANIPADHLIFLRGLRRYFETETHIFVHANYDPQLTLAQQPDDLLLWEHLVRSIPLPHCSGKTAVVGHTPQGTCEILDLGHVICIDTYCVGGGWLTALDVTRGTVWQANRLGDLRQ